MAIAISEQSFSYALINARTLPFTRDPVIPFAEEPNREFHAKLRTAYSSWLRNGDEGVFKLLDYKTRPGSRISSLITYEEQRRIDNLHNTSRSEIRIA